jgi:hypothetical protein
MPLHRSRPWNVALAGRLRALAILEAAERAALTPISAPKLHALAYLSDALSPVWGLTAFDPVALKTEREPFFGRFQDELDDLIILGLLEVTTFDYGGSDSASDSTGIQLKPTSGAPAFVESVASALSGTQSSKRAAVLLPCLLKAILALLPAPV